MTTYQRTRTRSDWARRVGYEEGVPGGEGPAFRVGPFLLPHQRVFYGPNAERKAQRDLDAHPLDMLAPVTFTVGAWP